MKINSNDHYLALAIKALDETITPELISSNAKSTVEILKTCLTELRKREAGAPSQLRERINEGYELLKTCHDVLSLSPPEVTVVDDQDSYATLIAAYNELTFLLANAARDLVSKADSHTEPLLREIATWELSYYLAQAEQTVAPLPEVMNAGSALDKERLQAFINSIEPWKGQNIVLDDFRSLPGGFGKQTFLCSFQEAGGSVRELVVRKLDPMPIMQHGACCLDNEYALLRCLPDDYPSPKPLAYAHDFQDLDADFYIVNRSPGDVPGAFLGGMHGDVPESVFLDLAEYLGRLHSVPLSNFEQYAAEFEVPGILNGSVSQAYKKNLEGWVSYYADQEHLDSPFMVWLLDWMANNIPSDERPPVIVHGDFNIHNVLVHEGQISAILDWECAGVGAPEQDLAYIRPHISQHIEWQRFLDHYLAHGGREPREELMVYGMVYASLRTNLAGNRATMNLQLGRNQDLRYAMVELGFTPSFMNLALQSINT